MWAICLSTLKGVFRDRVFRGVLCAALLFAFIPVVSSLSMRQVTELAATLSLSLISFILLLLAVFLGGPILWKDMERRYSYSMLGLPLSRTSYLLGKFAGIAIFLLLVSLVLSMAAALAVSLASTLYPPVRPVLWGNFVMALVFDLLKYELLVAFAFVLSTVSTSFFLPIFGAIAVYLAGSVSQQVYDFLQTASAQDLPWVFKQGATIFYYLLPNLSAFDLKVYAIYGLPLALPGLALTLLYWAVYMALLLACATLVFARREML